MKMTLILILQKELNEVVKILRDHFWDRQKKNVFKLMTGATEKSGKNNQLRRRVEFNAHQLLKL